MGLPSNSSRNKSKEPIAVIGSGCRFPGECNTPSKLWELLRNPRDLRSKISQSRFDPDGFYHPDNLHHGTSNVRHAYLLSEDHRYFDAQFFGIKPAEANSIDPQQRLLLETVYEGIESAGLRIEDLQGSQTAVYVGLMCGDYSDIMNRDPDSFPTYLSTGTARSIMSNRVSYFFDWHGPCMTIDTACSSSLVAVHQAVQTLRSGESRIAVAAGSNLCLGPEPYIAESKLKMLSPNGRSRMWDADADGYARGDGVAAVVLKTLSAALEDGDHIECLIRETGVNQDGRTKGITMPSAKAQFALIRETYAKAGLDLNSQLDRCQYFEAHGTGTPAGDPIEAEAISSAFFPEDSKITDKLYVGSIKTVIGHTEGTAGIAAMLKASLALQNFTIPPNMLFEKLSPAVRPFYQRLEIPTKAQKWPELPNGVPRRASVNSFGFGGTNAHAILESYEPSRDLAQLVPKPIPVLMPFTFSSVSEKSLAASLAAYSAFLKLNPSLNLRNLAWTLNSRRSNHMVKTSFSGMTTEGICAKIDAKLEDMKQNEDATIGLRPSVPVWTKPNILGVFTGQGAQWAGMGRALLQEFEACRTIVRKLETSLAELPEPDRPSFSLLEELMTEQSSSRLKEAAISQPVCAAIQIVLVDLLHAGGVKFDAVVGHSSGEIVAAYAAGLISANDAIRIAYYRGYHSKLARGSHGEQGSMMAIGTSVEDAVELCSFPEFKDRIRLAAVNSPASITLSGDAEAILQAKEVLEDEKKFARLLIVDKAYHSHHMLACSEAYISSLKACNIQVKRPESSGCAWYSSVFEGEMTSSEFGLKDSYWNDNMVNPVLFQQAVECATAGKGPFTLAIEVGPHPALQGPVVQTMQSLIEQDIAYSGLLRRGENAIESFADGLGVLWTWLGDRAVNFGKLDTMVSNGIVPRLLKDLPPYSWDHDRIFWQESRISKVRRTRHTPVHQLLGSRCTDNADQQFRWRNFLSPREVPWLTGHQIQGQMVFPGAGYISTALEAAVAISPLDSITLFEIQDFHIAQAIVFESNDSNVEILVTITDVIHEGHDTLTANFSYFSALGKDPTTMTLNAGCRLKVTYGSTSLDALPAWTPLETDMVDVPDERFYSSLEDLGYGYSGPFRALSSLKRKLGRATGLIKSPTLDESTSLILHPGMLDATIQSVMLAKSWPGDGRLWSLHVPTTIDRIAINCTACISGVGQSLFHKFQTTLSDAVDSGICGDIEIHSSDRNFSMVQMEGVKAVPLDGANPGNDRQLFASPIWNIATPDGHAAAWDGRATDDDYKLAYILERVAQFYLRKFNRLLPEDHPSRRKGAYVGLMNYARDICSRVSSGTHAYAKKEWADDTDEIIREESKR
jgi:hybrid polyketide synthase / nonribosomal peptide synthetase ACE1